MNVFVSLLILLIVAAVGVYLYRKHKVAPEPLKPSVPQPTREPPEVNKDGPKL